MTDETKPSPASAPKSLSLPLLVVGYVFMLGTAILAGRLIWEMTALTWQYGPQMIGFSLAHGSGALLFFFPLALFLWFLIAVVFVIVWKLKRNAVRHRTWLALGCATLLLCILSSPQEFWNTLFIGKLASSRRAPEFLVNAAGHGQQRIVRGLLQHGVPIAAKDREGDTALHLAAATGRTSLVDYLIDKGADVNALNLYGDSPLERAVANQHTDVIQALSSRGAKDLKGDEEQRRSASKEIVRRDIYEMNSYQR